MQGVVKRTWVIGGGLLLVAIVAVVAWAVSAGRDPVASRSREPAEAELRFPDVDPFEFFQEEGAEDLDETGSAPGPEQRGMRARRDEWTGLSREERRAKRLAMRERWLSMTPEERQEQRAERASRRVSVQATGEGVPQLEPVDVMESMREVRPQIRDCVRENGGWSALREASAAALPDGGAGGRGAMTVSFDVAADGAVSGVAMQPPPPAAFAQCFESAFQSLQMPAPDAEARVDVQFGGGRGGRARGGARAVPQGMEAGETRR